MSEVLLEPPPSGLAALDENSLRHEAWMAMADLWLPGNIEEDDSGGIYARGLRPGAYQRLYGLCVIIEIVEAKIRYPRHFWLSQALLSYGPYELDSGYCWPLSREGAAKRREFCLRMAERELWSHFAQLWKQAAPDCHDEYRVPMPAKARSAPQSAWGLCGCIRAYTEPSPFNPRLLPEVMPAAGCLWWRMHTKVREHAPNFNLDDFCWSLDEQGAKERVKFCDAMVEKLSFKET